MLQRNWTWKSATVVNMEVKDGLKKTEIRINADRDCESHSRCKYSPRRNSYQRVLFGHQRKVFFYTKTEIHNSKIKIALLKKIYSYPNAGIRIRYIGCIFRACVKTEIAVSPTCDCFTQKVFIYFRRRNCICSNWLDFSRIVPKLRFVSRSSATTNYTVVAHDRR